MKLDDAKVKHICQKALDTLKDKGLIVLKTDENKVLGSMLEAFLNNLKEEAQIEQEAKKLVEMHHATMAQTGMNQSKMFMMIKKELARKRGFIL